MVIAFRPAKSRDRTCLLCLQTLIQSFIRANEERSFKGAELHLLSIRHIAGGCP